MREIPRFPRCPELSLGIIKRITRIVFIESNPKPADILFIFGSNFGDRWEQVAEIFNQGLAPLVYIPGGTLGHNGQMTCYVIKETLMRLGVSEDLILTDNRSKDTLGDARFAKEFFERHGIRHEKILFACKAPHSGRCLRTLKKVFPQSELFSFIYEFRFKGKTVNKTDWWQSKFGRDAVWGEYQRILLYSRRGDIAR